MVWIILIRGGGVNAFAWVQTDKSAGTEALLPLT